MRRPLALLLAALSLALAGCAPAAPGGASSAPGSLSSPDLSAAQSQSDPEPQPEPVPEPDPRQEAVDRALSGMTLEEKVGQLFFARCPEMHAAALASESHLGGYILFGRDFKDRTREEVTDCIAAYQRAADIPLLIGVDEEGGTVVRVSSNPELAPHRFQSPQKLALASSGQGDVFAEDTWEKSSLLLSLGINVNFAPVADVSTDPGDFIYDRTLGQDAQATTEVTYPAVAWGTAASARCSSTFPATATTWTPTRGSPWTSGPTRASWPPTFSPSRRGSPPGRTRCW